MLKLKRVCIPLGLACNFRCEYCFRELSEHDIATELSDDMRKYLKWLDASWCEAVIMSGGEPLIYAEKIKEIFSLLKPNIHRKVMSNGSLLTDELADYFNEQRAEFMLSYDGAHTAQVRGVDVLNDKAILKRILQINNLTVMSVITNMNCDIMAVYREIVDKLGTSNFHFIPYPVYDNGVNDELIKGFDYLIFERSWREYRETVHTEVEGYSAQRRRVPLVNVDLAGNVHDKDTLTRCGTIFNTLDEITEEHYKAYENNYCFTSKCPLFDNACVGFREHASEHYCRCLRIMEGLD